MTTESEGWQKACKLSYSVGYLESVISAADDLYTTIRKDPKYHFLDSGSRERIDALCAAIQKYWEANP